MFRALQSKLEVFFRVDNGRRFAGGEACCTQEVVSSVDVFRGVGCSQRVELGEEGGEEGVRGVGGGADDEKGVEGGEEGEGLVGAGDGGGEGGEGEYRGEEDGDGGGEVAG